MKNRKKKKVNFNIKNEDGSNAKNKDKLLDFSQSEMKSKLSDVNVNIEQCNLTIDGVLENLQVSNLDEIKKLQKAQKNFKTVSVPLEKIHAVKIDREVTFENVKNTLNKWDPVIKANRVADQLKFPIEENSIYISKKDDGVVEEDFLSTFREPTPFEKKMAALLNSSKVEKDEKQMEENEFKLTLEELMQRRKLLAKVRAQVSYKASKDARQKKIKSKSYHRLLRRERLKQQMKDFDALKANDPEAALKQLESIEKVRALERATLRHRNTGHWAKSQIIRAKYNKQSRAALSEQIQKNRELTKKRKIVSDSEDDMELQEVDNEEDLNGELINFSGNVQNEFEKFMSEYHNYESNLPGNRPQLPSSSATNNNDLSKVNKLNDDEKKRVLLESNATVKQKVPSIKQKLNDNNTRSESGKKINAAKANSYEEKQSDKMDKIKQTKKHASVTDTKVTLINKSQRKEKNKQKTKRKSISKGENEKTDESILLDEQISSSGSHLHDSTKYRTLQSVSLTETNNQISSFDGNVDINPDDFLSLRNATQLQTDIPDFSNDDNGMDDDVENVDEARHMIISEAFADDDLVSEFRKEKQNAVEESLPTDINFSLPGWGSWTGGKNSSSKNKIKKRPKINKRLLFRIPAAPPRKDSNKGRVIIREEKDPKLRQHLVNELPYPFKTVKGFESTVRAPIGRDWVPETAYQDLIAPPVKTKLGAIIEPMNGSELLDDK